MSKKAKCLTKGVQNVRNNSRSNQFYHLNFGMKNNMKTKKQIEEKLEELKATMNWLEGFKEGKNIGYAVGRYKLNPEKFGIETPKNKTWLKKLGIKNKKKK